MIIEAVDAGVQSLVEAFERFGDAAKQWQVVRHAILGPNEAILAPPEQTVGTYNYTPMTCTALGVVAECYGDVFFGRCAVADSVERLFTEYDEVVELGEAGYVVPFVVSDDEFIGDGPSFDGSSISPTEASVFVAGAVEMLAVLFDVFEDWWGTSEVGDYEAGGDFLWAMSWAT